MATRSSIAILNNDGTVEGKYCHSDGYLSWNGVKLFQHYREINKIKELISLGDMSVLYEEIHPPAGKKHDFDNRCEGVSVFYGRDRRETNVGAKKYPSLEDYLVNGNFEEYDYVFNEKKNNWYLIDHKKKKLKKLSTLLLKDDEVSSHVKQIILAEKEAKKLNKELPQKENTDNKKYKL